MAENKERYNRSWKDAIIIAIVTAEAHCTGLIRIHEDSLGELTKTISSFITQAYGNRCIKDYKIATKLPKNLRLKWLLHEPPKLFFKIKAAKVARNCSSQGLLSFARKTEITFSRYDFSLVAGYLTNRPLKGNGSARFLKQKEFIDFWVHLLK